MKRIVAVCALLLATVAVAASQAAPPADSMTLPRAIGIVIQRNPSIAQAERTIEAAQSSVDLSRSGYLPEARGLLSYTYVSPIQEIQFGGTPFQLNPPNNYDGEIALHQTLYDFKKTSATVDVASARATLERDHFTEVQRDLAYATVRSFYLTLYLKESIRVQNELIRSLNEYLSVTERKRSAGTATEYDVLTTRVRLSAAETQAIDLQNQLRKEEIVFRRLGDLPEDYPVVFKGAFTTDSMTSSPKDFLDLAKRQRPDWKAAVDAVTSASMQVELARAHSNPSLDVNLAYGIRNGYIPNIDVLRGNYAANIGLVIPVFDAFRSRYLEEGARADQLALEEKRRNIENGIRSEIQQAVSNLHASADKLRSTKLNIDQAQRAAELARVKYEAGVITSLDVLDSETSLDEAKLTDLQAQFGYVLSAFELKRAVGEQIW